MLKKKMKVIVFAFMFVFVGTKTFAQGLPVLDMSNLLQAINSAYQYYQQIQNTIEQVQNTYKQIEQAAQQVAGMNWDDLKNLGDNFSGLGDNPFEVVTGVHKSAQDITKAVNKNMNKINELQSSLTSKTISFGGVAVSMADLVGAGEPGNNVFGFAKNAWDYSTGEDGPLAQAAKGYENKLTYAQKKAIMRKYKMSPENYAKLQLSNYQLNNLVVKGGIMSTKEAQEEMLKEIEANNNAIKAAAQKVPDGSIAGRVDVVNTGIANVSDGLGKLNDKVTQLFSFATEKLYLQKSQEAIQQQTDLETQESLENAGESNSSLAEDDM